MTKKHEAVVITPKEYNLGYKSGMCLPRSCLHMQIGGGDEILRARLIKIDKSEEKSHAGKVKGITKNGPGKSSYVVEPISPRPPPKEFPFVPDTNNARKLYFNLSHDIIPHFFCNTESFLPETIETIRNIYIMCANTSLKSKALSGTIIKKSWGTNLPADYESIFVTPMVYDQSVAIRLLLEVQPLKRLLERTLKNILQGNKIDRKEAISIRDFSQDYVSSEVDKAEMSKYSALEELVEA